MYNEHFEQICKVFNLIICGASLLILIGRYYYLTETSKPNKKVLKWFKGIIREFNYHYQSILENTRYLEVTYELDYIDAGSQFLYESFKIKLF